MALNKPEMGMPCNGCGLCCKTVVCGMGSFALGLVETYGDRADGPCPALEADGEKLVCGIIQRPKHYLPLNPRGVTVLREAAKLLIGAGGGCDEAGDEPEETAHPKRLAIQEAYLRRHSVKDLQVAARVIYDV